ncbi:MAG: hypothetical protein ACTHJ3_02615 [Pararhizobium sp.]
MIVRAECKACNRRVDFPADDLAWRFGQGREIDALPFRCGQCGRKAAQVFALLKINDVRS